MHIIRERIEQAEAKLKAGVGIRSLSCDVRELDPGPDGFERFEPGPNHMIEFDDGEILTIPRQFSGGLLELWRTIRPAP